MYKKVQRLVAILLIMALLISMPLSASAAPTNDGVTGGIVSGYYSGGTFENSRDPSFSTAEKYLLKEDGTVWRWGGTLSKPGDYKPPRKALDGIAKIVNLESRGTEWFIGKNGDLIHYSSETNYKPVVLIKDVKSVPFYGLVIKKDGSLYRNVGLEEQDGKMVRLTPVKVMDDVADAVGKENRGLAVKSDGTLWGWGWSTYGNLQTRYEKPTKLMDGVKSIYYKDGRGQYFMLKTDGTLWGWGVNHDTNDYGALGVGSSERFFENPTKIMSDVADFSMSGYSPYRFYALKADGSLWGWGQNTDKGGMAWLGDGSKKAGSTKPVNIMNGVKSVDAKGCIAIKKDGSLWSWNPFLNGNGQKIYTANKPVKILDNVVAATNQMAVKTDGTVWAWGVNNLSGTQTISTGDYTSSGDVYVVNACETGSDAVYVLKPEKVQGVTVR